VDTWGWEAFLAFYRDIAARQGESGTHAVSRALEGHFGLTLAALETRFVSAVQAQPLIPELREDVRLTVKFYDTVRLYQEVFDPSAYFLYAWLPDVDSAQRQAQVADLLRRPDSPANIALESLLYTSGETLRSGLYHETERTLVAVEAVIRAHQAGDSRPFAANPLGQDTLAALEVGLAAGFHVERIRLTGDRARLWVYEGGGELQVVELVRTSDMTWREAPLAD
jgi:hypothetical protein